MPFFCLRSDPMSLTVQHVCGWQHVITAYCAEWHLVLKIGYLQSGCMFQKLMVFHYSTIATNAALYEPRGANVAKVVYGATAHTYFIARQTRRKATSNPSSG